MSTIKENISNLQNLLNVVNALPNAGSSGVELPILTNEGSTTDLLSGKQLINQDGKIITGIMPNNGTITSTMDGIVIKSIMIPEGYTSGGTVSLDNTIDNEVDIQADLIVQIASALEGKASASGGIDTSDATATADKIFLNETAYVDNKKVTGTFSIDSELSTQDDLIAQIQSVVDNLPEAGDSIEPVLQDKTVTPTTSAQNVTPDTGYDGLSKVTVNAIPNAYVKPSSTKGATTYTPTTTNQTIAAGTYCSGVQTIKGDANLVASNIKSGVSIFGVNGILETGSGESGGGQVSGICPSLTITGDSTINIDFIYLSSNGQYQLDFKPVRQLPTTINNIDVGKPIFLEVFGSYEPAINNYNNLKIELNEMSSYSELICTCTSTLPATLNIIDND